VTSTSQFVVTKDGDEIVVSGGSGVLAGAGYEDDALRRGRRRRDLRRPRCGDDVVDISTAITIPACCLRRAPGRHHQGRRRRRRARRRARAGPSSRRAPATTRLIARCRRVRARTRSTIDRGRCEASATSATRARPSGRPCDVVVLGTGDDEVSAVRAPVVYRGAGGDYGDNLIDHQVHTASSTCGADSRPRAWTGGRRPRWPTVHLGRREHPGRGARVARAAARVERRRPSSASSTVAAGMFVDGAEGDDTVTVETNGSTTARSASPTPVVATRTTR
jgi:hypothetical protein